jgi:hypothetical protein
MHGQLVDNTSEQLNRVEAKSDQIKKIGDYIDAGIDIVDALVDTQSTTIKSESKLLLHDQQSGNVQLLNTSD